MDSNELYDIYDMWHVPWWQTTVFWWLIYAVSAIILITMLIIIFRLLYKKRKPEEPWEAACRQLALAYKKARENVDVELFYAEITCVLKWYLTIRFEDDSVARTDIELLSNAQQNPAFPKLLVPAFSQLLDHASHARFAKQSLPLDQLYEDYACARHVIEQTIVKQEKNNC